MAAPLNGWAFQQEVTSPALDFRHPRGPGHRWTPSLPYHIVNESGAQENEGRTPETAWQLLQRASVLGPPVIPEQRPPPCPTVLGPVSSVHTLISSFLGGDEATKLIHTCDP